MMANARDKRPMVNRLWRTLLTHSRRLTTMAESTTSTSTPRASLAALGIHLQRLDVFRPVREQVHVPQKTVRHTPSDKLDDALIAILAGAHGRVEGNTRLRSDP